MPLTLPEIKIPARPKGLRFHVSAVAEPTFEVRADASVPTISIFDVIGPEVTAARIAGALRAIGNRPLVVQINSPGGDYFEGATIYNLLRLHSQPVTVQVLGIAASAASLVAMAGERIEIARNAEIMIHNAHGLVVGNRNDMVEFAAILKNFDEAMAAVYAARTGQPAQHIAGLMDQETFLPADDALSLGFADKLLDRDAEPRPRTIDSAAPQSKRDLETQLRHMGYSKTLAARAAATAWPTLSGKQPELDFEKIAARLDEHARDRETWPMAKGA